VASRCTRKLIKDTMYCEGRVSIASVLNKGLHEASGSSPCHNSHNPLLQLKHCYANCMIAPECDSIFHY
jgi:hypothetical protein